MKKAILLISIFCMCLMVSGCYSVRMLSDREEPIIIARRTENLPYKETYKVWYALWGLVPISDNTTDKILATTKLKRVRINSKQTFVDVLISIVLGGSFSIETWTIEIEGSE